ncbi:MULTISPECIES: hypothetical protein [Hyphomicrobium]|uniref:hypothetical protein n=1 Tax=Hyphomicrobium TaxID=81 RepID=UPI0012EB95FA|nr:MULTISPECIES: hypothetical protein [Hyphomicrobium]WBT38173.1 hypothetical protein PE058_21380 [Hyphomicrobium sp. DMF-1]
MPLGTDKLKEQFQKSKKVRRAWSTYKWFDRIRGWQDWYNWLSTFLQTKAGAAAALGSTAVLTTAAVVVHNVVVDPYAEPYVPTEIAPLSAAEPMRQTKGTLIFEIEGRDKAGRRGTFDVVVAKKQFLWVRGSAEDLERDGRVISGAEIAGDVLDQEVRDGLASAREIVAVGTASQEGNPVEEKKRAARRATRTAELVSGAIDASIPISSLNLGQYRERCVSCDADGTNWQRPFMVIAVKELEEGTVVAEALADAMTGKERLPSPASYSAFELTKIR